MKILHMQITLLLTQQKSTKESPTTKRASPTSVPKQLLLPFAEMCPPDNENHT